MHLANRLAFFWRFASEYFEDGMRSVDGLQPRPPDGETARKSSFTSFLETYVKQALMIELVVSVNLVDGAVIYDDR